MVGYESEHTQFMREWMAAHPKEAEEQQKGRALWWDRPQSPELTKGFAEARVPTYKYYYNPSR
ncbi:MAG: DUF3460 family protein [Rhodocyclaceae bacterium]|nr:DUF3460 family protein [Rhodocyclaceae bacterium]